MAITDQTLYASLGFLSVIRWVDPSINIDSYIIQRTLSVGGNTAVPGDIMSADGETAGYVDIAVNTDLGFVGVFLNETIITADYDIDEAASDGISVDILRPTGGRTIIAVILDSTGGAATGIEEGDYVAIAGTAGHVAAWVYADSADSTDTEEIVIGRSAEDVTVSATADMVFHVWYQEK